MMRTGPEALLVKYKTEVRSGFAEFTLLQCLEESARGPAARSYRDVPVRRSATQRLYIWAQRQISRGEARRPTNPAPSSMAVGPAWEQRPRADAQADTTLAAIPAHLPQGT
ncbi:MAG: hypothetical protein WCA77_07955 [Thermoplasmata archaeon]